jgi:hypothetical protein
VRVEVVFHIKKRKESVVKPYRYPYLYTLHLFLLNTGLPLHIEQYREITLEVEAAIHWYGDLSKLNCNSLVYYTSFNLYQS